jgi:hypothetical protein
METTTSSYQTTPQTQPSTWSVGVKGGIYTGLIFVIYSLLTFITEWEGFQEANTLFSLISLIIGIWLTHKAFKDQGNGYMSYAQGLGLGTILGLVAGAINGLVSLLYLSFIDTAYMERQTEKVIIQLEEQGLSDAQIDQTMQFMEYTMNPVSVFFMSILLSVIFAFLVSLIVSAFTKNSGPTLEY